MSETQQVGRRTRRVTHTQLLHLYDYLNSHREIAVGFNKSAQAREHSKQKWAEVALMLNALGEGASKSGPEWSKYWVDLKSKIKKKNRAINDSRQQTVGGPSTAEELTDIERQFLSILGEDYGCGLPGVRVEPITEDHGQPSTSQSAANSEIIFADVQSNENVNEGQSTNSAPADSIYLHVYASENENEERPAPTASTSEASIPIKPEIPTQQPTPGPSQPPSDPSPQTSRPNRRLRRRRGATLTAAEARTQLVSSSRMRAEAELNNSRSIGRAVNLLEEMLTVFKNIEQR